MGRYSLPSDKKRGATLGVAVTEDELRRYHAAAKERGMKLAALVREAVERFLGAKPAEDYVPACEEAYGRGESESEDE